MEAAVSRLPAALRPPAGPRIVPELEVNGWEMEALPEASGGFRRSDGAAHPLPFHCVPVIQPVASAGSPRPAFCLLVEGRPGIWPLWM